MAMFRWRRWVTSSARGASAPRTRVESPSRSCQSLRRSESGFDAITETPKLTDHLRGSPLRARFGHGWTSFLVHDAIVQNLPHEPADAMRNRPDRLSVAEPDDEPSVEEFKDTAFGLHRSVCRLVEEPTHLSVAIRGPVAMIDAGALVVSRTGAHPGGQALGGREGRGGRTDFGDDLLRGIDAKARHRCQSFDGVLMDAEQLREFLIEVTGLRLDHFPFIEEHRQQPAVHGIQIRARAERIAQLVGRGVKPRTAQRGDRRRIGVAVGY